MRGIHAARSPATIMSWMDSYIYNYRASHNPPKDPDGISITKEQYQKLKDWATDRPHQGRVVVDSDGGMHYNGVKVNVR